MNQQKHKQSVEFNEHESSDDFTALNYLLEHVRGLSPSSFTPEFALEDGVEVE